MLPQAEQSSEIDLLAQIAEILQNSTIAEERGQDVRSKFWAAYKKVSSEYDGDMLERSNANMDIVLIFAGLFSAVNTAFIVSMQPNPLDTTNYLLLQLIRVSVDGPSAVKLSALSASTGYSSANIWTQALAYTSLAFSLLAAFGAVLGKQWLGYYKTNAYGSGSLEARCKQRHRKFETLQSWQFQWVLQSFPVLLQMSLLLFGLSIGAAMWTQQIVISILVLGTTAFGLFCQVFTIVVSVTSPDCPFQTPFSLAIQTIFRHFPATTGLQAENEDPTANAVQWILETSTNPEVVRTAVELMPIMSTRPNVDIVSLCKSVRDMFNACFDHRGTAVQEDSAFAYGNALIRFSWGDRDVMNMLRDSGQNLDIWGSWRSLCLVRSLEQCRISYDRMAETRNTDLTSWEFHQADTRTALRVAVTTGINGFAHPDDEKLIWDSQFRAHPSEVQPHFIDELICYMEHFHDTDDLDVAADALLIASGIATASIPQSDICRTICVHLASLLNTTHRRWRCVVLGTACRFLDNNPSLGHDKLFSEVVLMTVFTDAHSIVKDPVARDEFLFTSAIDMLNFIKWPEGNNLCLSPLPEIQRLVLYALRLVPAVEVDNSKRYTPYCHALIHLMGAGIDPTLRYSALHIVFDARLSLAAAGDMSQRDMVLSNLSPALLTLANDGPISKSHLTQYLSIISTLARSPTWCHRLITDGHDEKCTTLITNDALEGVYIHIAGFFLRIAPPWQDSCSDCITSEQWWTLIKMTWYSIAKFIFALTDEDTIDIIRSLVRGTEVYIPQDLPKDDLGSLSEWMHTVHYRLESQLEYPQSTVVPAVADLKDIIDERLEAMSKMYFV